jgi:hypothetical protein
MDPTLIYVVIIVAIIIAVFMVYCIQTYTGWIPFTMKYDENFKILIAPNIVSRIRFKNCIYTIVGLDGKSVSRDVTNQLNYMVIAFHGNTEKKYVFKLDGGLSPYSFIINGISDAATNKSNGGALTNNWANTTNVSLVGNYKLL